MLIPSEVNVVKTKFAFIALITAINAYSAPDVIYGKDNRLDTYEVKTEKIKEWAKSTAAMIPSGNIRIRGNTAELEGGALSEMIPGGFDVPICKKERFSAQPTSASCSGFLVAPNVLVTAGHCVQSQASCRDMKWVFDYQVEDKNQRAVSVPKENVFSCTRVIKSELSDSADFAIVQLDRVVPRTPVKIVKNDPGAGTPLVMIGHPSGLPQKVTDKGRLMTKLKNFYKTDFDAFGGNSGSAVFRRDTGELVGILVNGKTDYKLNTQQKCLEVNGLRPKDGGEKLSSFKQFIKYL
jgi:V8-like Glu-specific endopeptidase